MVLAGRTDPRVGTLGAIQSALEEAGVVFVPENGGGAGVRFFKEKLVGWKQCTTPLPRLELGIQDAFERLYMEHGAPNDAALFGRISKGSAQEIFICSPSCRRFQPRLPGEWVDAVNPALFRWSLLVGHSRAFEWLGICPGVD